MEPTVDDLFQDVRISVSAELHEHYTKIVNMRDKILGDPESEDKTIVSILNAVTTILKEMDKLQQSVYNTETSAVLQQLIIDTLKEESPELQERIVEAFEEKQRKLFNTPQ
jgi:peptidoglycan hydrolase CwlO-like protein